MHESCDKCWDIKGDFSTRSGQTVLGSWHVASSNGAITVGTCTLLSNGQQRPPSSISISANASSSFSRKVGRCE